jgi:hypothetical protein
MHFGPICLTRHGRWRSLRVSRAVLAHLAMTFLLINSSGPRKYVV